MVKELGKNADIGNMENLAVFHTSSPSLVAVLKRMAFFYTL